MKKIYDKKTLFAFIIGGLLFGTIGVGAATFYRADQMTYNNDKTSAKNVKSAIDELYELSNKPSVDLSFIKYTYNYTGGIQIFTAPIDGVYKFELWGGSGANSGLGSYTSGTVQLTKDDVFYVYVGGLYNGVSGTAVFNNGTGTGGGYPSGGATDVRYFGHGVTPSQSDLLWNNVVGLRSRVMVAASGGLGQPGGGLTGYSSGTNGGSQTAGGSGDYGAGGFGLTGGGCTGGTGWYGAGGGTCASGTGGGSSYISGHTGCVGITSATSSTPKSGCSTGTTDNACSIHYSNIIFTDTIMIDGKGYNWTNIKGSLINMPATTGDSKVTGNNGSGFVRITLLSI